MGEREKIAAMSGVRPMLRPVMCGPFWWLLLVFQAIVAVPLAILVNINVPEMWRDYRDSLKTIVSTRRAIDRAPKDTQ